MAHAIRKTIGWFLPLIVTMTISFSLFFYYVGGHAPLPGGGHGRIPLFRLSAGELHRQIIWAATATGVYAVFQLICMIFIDGYRWTVGFCLLFILIIIVIFG